MRRILLLPARPRRGAGDELRVLAELQDDGMAVIGRPKFGFENSSPTVCYNYSWLGFGESFGVIIACAASLLPTTTMLHLTFLSFSLLSLLVF